MGTPHPRRNQGKLLKSHGIERVKVNAEHTISINRKTISVKCNSMDSYCSPLVENMCPDATHHSVIRRNNQEYPQNSVRKTSRLFYIFLQLPYLK